MIIFLQFFPIILLLPKISETAIIANFSNTECGSKPPSRRGSVIGGVPAKIGEFPWLVSIRLLLERFRHHCGGSIVNKQWILTAGHCVCDNDLEIMMPAKSFGAILGVNLLDRIEIMKKIVRIEVPPSYSCKQSKIKDYALMRTGPEIKWWNDLVKPVCFYDGDEYPIFGFSVFAVGWGILRANDSEEFDPSNLLMKAKLTAFKHDYCSKMLPSFDRTVHVCAGDNAFQVDVCKGDDGGPLMTIINGKYVMLAITSEVACARPNQTGIYTKIQPILSWIKHVAVILEESNAYDN